MSQTVSTVGSQREGCETLTDLPPQPGDRDRFADRPRRLFWRFRQLIIRELVINKVIASKLVSTKSRVRAMRAWGADVAPDALILQGNTFSTNRVTFGEGSAALGSFFDNHARVTIHRRAGIGIGCTFLTRTHPVGPPERRLGHADVDLPIVIGEGSWLGAGVIVLGGVTVGEGCVIATGAVVTTDCEPNGLYGGVPAKRLRELD